MRRSLIFWSMMCLFLFGFQLVPLQQTCTAQEVKLPTVKDMVPGQGAVGEPVCILGENFGRNPGDVLFSSGVSAEITFWSNEIVLATVPFSAKNGPVSLVSSGGLNVMARYFEVYQNPSRSSDFYVSVSTGSDVSGNGTMANPWASIGHAIYETYSVANKDNPVRIHIATGVYYENLNLSCYQSLLGGYSKDFLKRNVDDRNNRNYSTVIDGQNQNSVIKMIWYSPPHSTVISGLTIQNGKSDDLGGGIDANAATASIVSNTITACSASVAGGAIDNCYGEISDNVIIRNSAKYGAGLNDCYGNIIGNTISHNIASVFGGGLNSCGHKDVRSIVISGNIISQNTASVGGGGLNRCYASILSNTITGNQTDGDGGGLDGCLGRIEGNQITKNISEYNGAGLHDCDGPIINNLIQENVSNWFGGGLFVCDGEITHNTIVKNTAAGHSGGLGHCHGTISENNISENSAGTDGGGLYYCRGNISYNTITNNVSGGRGGGIAYSGDVEGGSVTGNHANGLGGGICYSSFYQSLTNVEVSDNTCDERPSLLECKCGYILLQDIDNIYAYDLPWYQCIPCPVDAKNAN